MSRDRVAADQEDLGVALAADILEAHELRPDIIVRQLGAKLEHLLYSFLYSSSCRSDRTFLTGGSL
jgi:hypothetical protein